MREVRDLGGRAVNFIYRIFEFNSIEHKFIIYFIEQKNHEN